MKTLTEQDIDQQFDAAKNICKTLLPLSVRAQRRILIYFQDAVQDSANLNDEYSVLKKVSEMLRIELP